MSEKKVPTKKAEAKEAKMTKEEKLMNDIHELIDDILDVKEEFDKKGIFADVSSMLGDTSTVLGAVIAKKMVDDNEPIIVEDTCEECCDVCEECEDDCCCENGDNLIPMSDNAVIALNRFINVHFITTLKSDNDADMNYVSGVGEVHDCIKEVVADIYAEQVEEIADAALGALIGVHEALCGDNCSCSDVDDSDVECKTDCKCEDKEKSYEEK